MSLTEVLSEEAADIREMYGYYEIVYRYSREADEEILTFFKSWMNANGKELKKLSEDSPQTAKNLRDAQNNIFDPLKDSFREHMGSSGKKELRDLAGSSERFEELYNAVKRSYNAFSGDLFVWIDGMRRGAMMDLKKEMEVHYGKGAGPIVNWKKTYPKRKDIHDTESATDTIAELENIKSYWEKNMREFGHNTYSFEIEIDGEIFVLIALPVGLFVMTQIDGEWQFSQPINQGDDVLVKLFIIATQIASFQSRRTPGDRDEIMKDMRSRIEAMFERDEQKKLKEKLAVEEARIAEEQEQMRRAYELERASSEPRVAELLPLLGSDVSQYHEDMLRSVDLLCTAMIDAIEEAIKAKNIDTSKIQKATRLFGEISSEWRKVLYQALEFTDDVPRKASEKIKRIVASKIGPMAKMLNDEDFDRILRVFSYYHEPGLIGFEKEILTIHLWDDLRRLAIRLFKKQLKGLLEERNPMLSPAEGNSKYENDPESRIPARDGISSELGRLNHIGMMKREIEWGLIPKSFVFNEEGETDGDKGISLEMERLKTRTLFTPTGKFLTGVTSFAFTINAGDEPRAIVIDDNHGQLYLAILEGEIWKMIPFNTYEDITAEIYTRFPEQQE